MNEHHTIPQSDQGKVPAEHHESRTQAAKWAVVVNDALVLLPRRVTARLVKEEAGTSPDLTLVRDHGSPNDIPLNDEQKLDLAEGNVFYTLPRCEVKPAIGCAA